MQQNIWADSALTTAGWQNNVSVELKDDRIVSVTADASPRGTEDSMRVGILLPAPSNLHSHGFQRAMAGLTEARGPDPSDSFWTWRRLMYRFLDQLTPDDIEAINAFVFMQMAEAGYAAVAEFHYLHHQPDGKPYTAIAEMSHRIASAAAATGIGLSLLPVLYQYGGCDQRELGPGQIRFGNDVDQFARLFDDAKTGLADLPDDTRIGTAPHSLRAVDHPGVEACVTLADNGPVHLHVSEQIAEVEEVREHHGATPGHWLMDNFPVDERWCFIHCTQMESDEIKRFAQTGGVTGLCPVTESSLGDGIFDIHSLRDATGRFGIGSDSNIRISLAEELRLLEFSQRLRDRKRAIIADPGRSTGRVLFESACTGGAAALGRHAGCIAPGYLGDLVALDAQATDLQNRTEDLILDSYLFASDDSLVTDVWSAGRHIVTQGKHHAGAEIESAYRKVVSRLMTV